jgi:hypothetical protein
LKAHQIVHRLPGNPSKRHLADEVEQDYLAALGQLGASAAVSRGTTDRTAINFPGPSAAIIDQR